MERDKIIELVVGMFMLIGIVALSFLAYRVSNFSDHVDTNGYFIQAHFDNVGDLKPRAAVKLAGVKIGKVSEISIDPKTYKATVTMWVSKDAGGLPTDSSASIFTAGLLGANYVSITPGFDETQLQDGDLIEITHPALILENLIGHLLFKTESDK